MDTRRDKSPGGCARCAATPAALSTRTLSSGRDAASGPDHKHEEIAECVSQHEESPNAPRPQFLSCASVLSAPALLRLRAQRAPQKKSLQGRLEHLRRLDALGLCAESGILKKWADKYGIKIELTQINDYVESINQYTAGAFDGCVMTNMDMLTIPSAGGVDSTALIVGDFSNGNDGVVMKGKGKKLADIKGLPVNLVELSVSHYLLARGLETVGLQGTRHQGRQHLRRRHRRCVRRRGHEGDRDVETAVE